jgi:hypothetical protein
MRGGIFSLQGIRGYKVVLLPQAECIEESSRLSRFRSLDCQGLRVPRLADPGKREIGVAHPPLFATDKLL